ncbi:alpha/beta fold hydrolase [Alicyclobacillus dauci]|uniref:Alpha/beta hydrolase n=1 Tax=Alicyclobacillus dauci TaxID=1475485 RepID=A0ABY6Z969_9BACL|nr:alpha/beta fold hydrolase [Alicyclobacillus dauci]WAH39339.1 alpha/beta hydrolase [Alicyclobacillus dauci]
MIIFYWIFAMFLLVIITLLTYRRFVQQAVLKRSVPRHSPHGISTVKTVTIGGIEQAVLIQAHDSSKPVLLLLHGGPGMPAPGVSFRGVDYAYATTTFELMKHYVLVFWDQRGTGRSFHTDIPSDTMNLEQFVSDANELVDHLRNRFHQEKIYLAGLSWGTVIGLTLASRYPEKFHAYAAMAQIVNWSESDQICYDWNLHQAKEKGNRKATSELVDMGCPPYRDVKTWLTLRKWNFMQGAFVYEDEHIKAPILKQYPKTLLSSPDYSIRDVLRIFTKTKNSYTDQMVLDFLKIDFAESVPVVSIPVYFFHGRHDHAVPGLSTKRYYDKLIAPKGKHLVWLENSAHMFYPNDARIVERCLIQMSSITQDVAQNHEENSNLVM